MTDHELEAITGVASLQEFVTLPVIGESVDNGAVKCTATSTDSGQHTTISNISPLPLPEQIIHLVIDEVRLDRERSIAAFSCEDTQSTSKAIDHAFRFDDDLKCISLISRLWTQPARHALGRTFILIMDEKRLPRLSNALDSPLYGPWTSHVEILEVPCTGLRDRDSAIGVWELVQRMFGRLEKVRSFTINSRILWSSISRLPLLLPYFKYLEELTLINTGIIITSNGMDAYHQKLADLSSTLPHLRKMSLQRCLPSGDSASNKRSLTSQDSPEFSLQLQAIISSLFSSFNCCFMAKIISFVFDREEMRWIAEEMTASHSRSICSAANCEFRDPSGVCAAVRSLRVVGETKRINASCTANLLRNFVNAKVLHLSLSLLPAGESLDALSPNLEEAIFKIRPGADNCDINCFDEQLSRFSHARRSKLRRLTLSLSENEWSGCFHNFALTDSVCSKHGIEFIVHCDP